MTYPPQCKNPVIWFSNDGLREPRLFGWRSLSQGTDMRASAKLVEDLVESFGNQKPPVMPPAFECLGPGAATTRDSNPIYNRRS